MINALSSSTPAATGSGPARHSRSLDAQLSTARAKMEDWVTCPSVKTPEGKAQLKKATAKVQAIESEIKKADDAAAQADAAKKASSAKDAPARGAAAVGSVTQVGDEAMAELARRHPAAASMFGASPSLGGNLSVQA